MGVREAQLVHAVGDSVSDLVYSSGKRLPKTTRSVVLKANDEASLMALASKLREADISHSQIIESEGSFSGQLMAVGVVPCKKETVCKYLSSLPLWRG